MLTGVDAVAALEPVEALVVPGSTVVGDDCTVPVEPEALLPPAGLAAG
jgi:hypothetical protein